MPNSAAGLAAIRTATERSAQVDPYLSDFMTISSGRRTRAAWHIHCKPVRRAARGRAPMTIYDRPFDPNRPLDRSGASAAAIAARRSMTDDARRTMHVRAGRRAERREDLRGRRRLRGDAGDVPAGRRAPRLPEIGRRLDRARRALAILPAQDRDRGVRARRRRSRRRTSRSASSRSPAPRRSSWRSRWASMRSTGSTSK